MKKIEQKKTVVRKTATKAAHAPKEGVHSVLSAIAAGGEGKAAFDKTADERAALDPAVLAPRNIDMRAAANTALVAYPHMVKHRAQLATDPGFDLARFDDIETYANAMLYAQSQSANDDESGDSDLYEEGRMLREVFVSEVSTLVLRKVLKSNTLDEVNTTTGYQNISDGLGKLCSIVENKRSLITESRISAAELSRAQTVGSQLGKLAISRDDVEPTEQISETRSRALTLLLNAYDDARAAIAYVRRKEGDVNAIAPSLYSYRTGRRKADAITPAAPPVTTAPATPTPPAVTATPAAPAETSPSNGAPTNGATATIEGPTL